MNLSKPRPGWISLEMPICPVLSQKKEWTQTFSRRMESVQHKKVDWAGAAANDVRKAQHSLGEDALADTLNASKFKLEVLKTRICVQSTPSM